MKKIKLISALTSLGVIGTAVPITATSCANASLKSNDDGKGQADGGQETPEVTPQKEETNAGTHDIRTLNWIKRVYFETNDDTKVKNTIISDNARLFAKYPALSKSGELAWTITSDTTAKTLSISIAGSSSATYFTTDAVTWSATYSIPTPEPEPEPEPTVVKLHYSELIAKIGSLTAGTKYRIDDYAASVLSATSTDPYYQTAGAANNQAEFDIVVTALDANTLSEDATAIAHTAETNEEDKFTKWTVKYAAQPTNTKYDWTDTTSGKGCIYYLKDEFGNEAPYDFKNIKMLPKGATYTAVTDFKYTFSKGAAGNSSDASMGASASEVAHDNKIAAYYNPDGAQSLNMIILENEGGFCYGNTFDAGCNNITLGKASTGNKFGVDCAQNTIGDNAVDNTFGNGFVINTIGNQFVGNTFAANCTSNVIKNAKTDGSAYQLGNYFGYGINSITIEEVQFERNFVLAGSGSTFISPSVGQIINEAPEASIVSYITYTSTGGTATTTPTVQKNGTITLPNSTMTALKIYFTTNATITNNTTVEYQKEGGSWTTATREGTTSTYATADLKDSMSTIAGKYNVRVSESSEVVSTMSFNIAVTPAVIKATKSSTQQTEGATIAVNQSDAIVFSSDELTSVSGVICSLTGTSVTTGTYTITANDITALAAATSAETAILVTFTVTGTAATNKISTTGTFKLKLYHTAG